MADVDFENLICKVYMSVSTDTLYKFSFLMLTKADPNTVNHKDVRFIPWTCPYAWAIVPTKGVMSYPSFLYFLQGKWEMGAEMCHSTWKYSM